MLIAADVGGTKTSIAIIDDDKKILKISELTEEQKEILKSMVYLEKGLFIRELNL